MDPPAATGFVLFISLLSGCAGPGPRLFPAAPLSVLKQADGRVERQYDTDRDGRPDRAEVLSPDGLVEALRYDTTGDGVLDLNIRLGDIPRQERRHLVLILDSIPFRMVHEAYNQGRFRFFRPPVRVISPFPVMTDLSLSELFGTVPCPGVESAYYDGRSLKNGYDVYVKEENACWTERVDYHMNPVAHAFAYLWPPEWYDHELRRIQNRFHATDQRRFIGYIVGTSALGARRGRNGHQMGLLRLERFCRTVMFESRGRVHITLLSDHGHRLMPSRRVALSDLLEEFGYNVGPTIHGPGDVVVPEFGMVSCAAIYTQSPEQVARDVIGIEGIELTACRDDADRVLVFSREGRASIVRSDAGFRYACDFGDPLGLQPILQALARRGQVNPDGFVRDDALFEATHSHTYPDVVYRLWRAFHGLMLHTPDVLVSVQDGYHCGSAMMSSMVELVGVHGNLRATSSTAFLMTTAGELPAVLRMEDVAETLAGIGVPIVEEEEARPAATCAPAP